MQNAKVRDHCRGFDTSPMFLSRGTSQKANLGHLRNTICIVPIILLYSVRVVGLLLFI